MSPALKGPVSQRELVTTLKTLIDDSMAPNSTAHRDIARTKLRALLAEANWRTPFIFNNLSSRRCRYLASIGHWVPSRWMLREWGKPEVPDVG